MLNAICSVCVVGYTAVMTAVMSVVSYASCQYSDPRIYPGVFQHHPHKGALEACGDLYSKSPLVPGSDQPRTSLLTNVSVQL